MCTFSEISWGELIIWPLRWFLYPPLILLIHSLISKLSCICRETCTGWEWQGPHLPATLWAPLLTHFLPNLLIFLWLFCVTTLVPEPVKQGPCLFVWKDLLCQLEGREADTSLHASSSFLVGTLSRDVTQGYVKDRGHAGIVLVMETSLPPSQGQSGQGLSLIHIWRCRR